MKPVSHPPLRQLLSIALTTRLLVDTSVQMFFPYLPLFAAGLGITVVQMGQLNSVRTLVGLSAPLYGAWADRAGYRPVMRFGLSGMIVGLVLFGSAANIWQAVAAMVLLGVGLNAFGPNLFAYIGGQVPFARRSRALGALELSWALAGIVGVSAMGLLIDRYGWRMPLFLLAGGLLFGVALIGRLPASDRDAAQARRSAARGGFFDLGPNRRSAWAAVAATSLTLMSAVHLISAYGAWLFDEYALSASELGRVALVLGFAALVSNLLITFAGDRIGSLRAMRVGALLALVAHAALPLFNVALAPAVIALAVAHVFFEFTVVNGLIVNTEQAPDHRGKVMTMAAAFSTLGLTVANFTGPLAYERLGLPGLAWPSAVGFLGVWLLVVGLVRQRR